MPIFYYLCLCFCSSSQPKWQLIGNLLHCLAAGQDRRTTEAPSHVLAGRCAGVNWGGCTCAAEAFGAAATGMQCPLSNLSEYLRAKYDELHGAMQDRIKS